MAHSLQAAAPLPWSEAPDHGRAVESLLQQRWISAIGVSHALCYATSNTTAFWYQTALYHRFVSRFQRLALVSRHQYRRSDAQSRPGTCAEGVNGMGRQPVIFRARSGPLRGFIAYLGQLILGCIFCFSGRRVTQCTGLKRTLLVMYQ